MTDQPNFSERLRLYLSEPETDLTDHRNADLVSEVKSLEIELSRAHLLRNDLVEMEKRYKGSGRNFSRYQWILNRLLGVSEEAQFEAELEAEQDRLKGEGEAQAEAEARYKEEIAREEEMERYQQSSYPEEEPEP